MMAARTGLRGPAGIGILIVEGDAMTHLKLATFALALFLLVSGCGDDTSTPKAAAPLSPEAQQKQEEILSNYGQNYNEKFRSESKSKSKKR